jgi:hypothetical protein
MPWSHALLALLCALSAVSARAAAQEEHWLPIQGGAPITGQPLSALRTLDYQPSPDSADAAPVHAEQMLYRDSFGRTRSETRYPGLPQTVDILDPVAHRRYHWADGDYFAVRSALKESAALPASKQEKLEEDAPLIEGVPTRYANTRKQLPDGHSETIESWYAPSLHLALMTVVDRAGEGKTTYRFQHLKLVEPDLSLFQPPGDLAVHDLMKPPPPVPPPASSVSSAAPAADGAEVPKALPHPTKDGNYLEALTRFHAAVPKSPSLAQGFHRHTEFRLIDIRGGVTTAIQDSWHKGNLGRDEELAPEWHSIIVWGSEENWSVHQGIRPMRIGGLFDVAPRPGPMERRIRILGKDFISLRPRQIDGTLVACSSNYGGAEICFNQDTGFPAEASLDDERVVYRTWSEFAGKYFPSRWAVYRGGRLQMEVNTAIAGLEMTPNLFDPLPGVDPRPNLRGAQLEDSDQVLSKGELKRASFGQALVKVSVDRNGRVTRAELVDADDKSLAAAAIEAAKKTVYMPRESAAGENTSFETAFRVEQWSTVDPIRIGATSLKSQASD